MQNIKKENAIVLKNLYSIYNEDTSESFVALKNINFTFEKNKIYCIIGQSGSGKSTLINYFNGLSKPKFGSVVINGIELNGKYYLNKLLETLIDVDLTKQKKIFKLKQNNYLFSVANNTNKSLFVLALKQYANTNPVLVKKLNSKLKKELGINNDINVYLASYEKPVHFFDIPKTKISNLTKTTTGVKSEQKFKKKIKNYKELRKSVGMIYQFPEFQLFKSTVLEDVMFGPKNLGIDVEQAKKLSISILDKLGMPEQFLSYSPFGLSGGQKRRVAISGILAINTDIVVFDEPTAGLDPAGEKETLSIINEIKANNKTAIVVTHSMEHVLEIADEIIVIHDGKIVKTGKPYDVFSDHKVMNDSCIELPNVIKTIQALVLKNKKFKKLYDYEPRTVGELANAILALKKKVNKKVKS